MALPVASPVSKGFEAAGPKVYFTDDPHSPISRAEWEAALAGIKAQLGLAGISVPYAAGVFLGGRIPQRARRRRVFAPRTPAPAHEALLLMAAPRIAHLHE